MQGRSKSRPIKGHNICKGGGGGVLVGRGNCWWGGEVVEG